MILYLLPARHADMYAGSFSWNGCSDSLLLQKIIISDTETDGKWVKLVHLSGVLVCMIL
jgi:hypothetical protein